MASFKKINTKVFMKNSSELNSNTVYWKNYNVSVLVKEFGPIDYIDFSSKEPYHFAATCSCRVQIYNPITKLVNKNLNKFKESAYGGSFRRDGRLLCAGGEENIIKLFDVNTRSPLRIFNGHQNSVHRAFFTLDGIHIISFSDDKTTALWDISNEKRVIVYQEHNDYIRAGSVSPVSPNIYISGGYDKIINMYDTRISQKIFSINHDAPVESVLFLPSGGVFLSAGGTEIRVWDCLANGKLFAKISQHHKTITCLQTAFDGRRIMSGSLDKHVKIYDSGSYKTVHTLDYPNSVLSIGISPDNKTIVTGMIDGMISIRQKEKDIDEKSIIYKKIPYKYAGESLHCNDFDLYVNEERRVIIGKHDACLRKFQYSKALDHVLMNYIVKRSPYTTIALLQELIRRQGIIQALAGRDGKPLVNIIRFIIRQIGNLQFGRVLLYIANILMDIYEDRLNELNLESQVMFIYLAKKLKEEQTLILMLTELQGSFEMILSATETITFTGVKHLFNFTPSITAQEHIILNVI